MKKSFILYLSFREQIELLTMEQRGQLLTAIFDCAAGVEPCDLDPATKMCFSFIASQMKRDSAKHEEICQKRAEAGKLGGRPPKSKEKHDKPKKAKGFSEKQKNPDNDTDNDTDNVNEKTKGVFYPADEKLNQAFLDYIEMRKKIRKPLTDRALQLAQKKLQELSTVPFGDSMDNNLAIRILEQSILNGWQDLYPLKNDKGNGKQGSNVFDDWRNA